MNKQTNVNHQCLPRIEYVSYLIPSNGVLISRFFPVAHLLQVTALEGSLGEVVPLLSVIPASPRPQGWLATLEHNMRNTLVRSLAECVKRRLENKDGAAKLLELLTTVGEYSKITILLTFAALLKSNGFFLGTGCVEAR